LTAPNTITTITIISNGIMTNITPTERVEQYETLARDFFQNHIPRVQGVNLSPALRWAIVQCALDALEACPACNDSCELPKDVCLRPGSKILPIIQRMEHCEFPNVDIDIDDMLLDTTIMDIYTVMDTSTSTMDATTIAANDAAIAKSTLRNLIHTVINHQGRINKEWYEDTIQALKESCGSLLSSSPLMPPGNHKEQNDTTISTTTSTTTSMIRVHSIFAEILVLTVVTQCIHGTYLVLDRPLPPFPKPATPTKTTMTGAQEAKAQEGQPQPLDWSSMTRTLPTRDDSVVWTPFFRPWHICWKKMAAASSYSNNSSNCLDANEQRTLQIALLFTGVPYLGATLAPVDLLKALVPVHQLYYLDEWVRTITATAAATHVGKKGTNVCVLLLLLLGFVCLRSVVLVAGNGDHVWEFGP
jgi:hypothetical protein